MEIEKLSVSDVIELLKTKLEDKNIKKIENLEIRIERLKENYDKKINDQEERLLKKCSKIYEDRDYWRKKYLHEKARVENLLKERINH